MRTDNSDLVMAMRLLDHLKLCGFEFRRAGLGEDGPQGEIESAATGIEGFSRDCFAWRRRASSLIVPGRGLIERRVHGSALDVLNEVLTWQMGP